MKSIYEIAEILLKSNYLNIQIKNNYIEKIKFLPLGLILLNKIKFEWYQSKGIINTYTITNNDYKTIDEYSYYKSDKFHENFLYIKNNFQKELPLAIKEEFKLPITELSSLDANDSKTPTDENKIIKINYNTINDSTLLTCTYFINDQLSKNYFYKIQRERKIWWMKLSSNPQRFFLTDLKINSNNDNNNYKMYSVKIKSKFNNFHDIELENIHVIPLKSLKLQNQNDFYLKDIKLNKRMIPTVIRTELQLENATIGFLLDAVEEKKNSKMSLNRTIAPYQCCLFCLSDDEKVFSELQELATHLANVMRKSDISVLNLPKCYVTTAADLKKEIHQMDKIGVPYNIILESNSLKDGLMKLRNRDTTISETIHISDLPNYLDKIFKSQ